jgi:hypothetical protein
VIHQLPVSKRWSAWGGPRRLGRAGLAIALGLGVVIYSADRGAGSLGPWAGFVGTIGLMFLAGGLLFASPRILGGAAGVLGVSAALGGASRVSGTSGGIEDAVLGACLLLIVEIGCWSGEARGGSLRGRDARRFGAVIAAAAGGGAVGGLAVAIATNTSGLVGGVLPVALGALACCLILLLAVVLVAPER